MRTEPQCFAPLRLRSTKRHHATAHLAGELDCHVAQSADTDHAHGVGGADAEVAVQHSEDGRAGAHQGRGVGAGYRVGNFVQE